MTEILSFGEWVRRRRRALDLTQDELAARAGCSKELVAKIEGDARRPSKQVAALLAGALELAPDEHEPFVRAARAELATDRLPAPARSVPRPALAALAVGAEPQVPSPKPAPGMPLPPTPLIGREREVAEVITLVSRLDVRLVTLTGAGGSGKTRVALHVGAAVTDRYPDGVWFVDLSPVSAADQLIPAIAQVLGLTETAGQTLVTRLQFWLRGRAAMLILDNCEQIVDAVAEQIASMLRAHATLTILATSRIPLRLLAEHEYPVGPLELPDLSNLPSLRDVTQSHAVALFIARARAIRPTFEVTSVTAPMVAEICHRLDGLPLAIELAAARVRTFPVEALLTRLSQGHLQTLTGGARDVPARQKTIQATIDWSYRLLSPDQQRLLARLAVFVGGWTLEAAQFVCSDGAREVAGDLDVLVEHSMVRQISAGVALRYGMLETIREFGLQRLADSGEEPSIRERHARYLVQLAEEQNELRIKGIDGWAEPLRTEEANIDAAITWCCTVADDRRSGIRLAQALDQYWSQTTQQRTALHYDE